MGNVMASQSRPTPPPNAGPGGDNAGSFPAPPLSPPKSTSNSASFPAPPLISPVPEGPAADEQREDVQDDTSVNPGLYEDLHRRCKDVFPMAYEGARMVFSKPITPHMQVNHTVHLSATEPSAYKLAATYVGQQVGSRVGEFSTFMQGETDFNGQVNGTLVQQVSENLRCKTIMQLNNRKLAASQLTADYKGRNYSASVTIANPNLFNNSGAFISHYLHNVTSKLAVGAEFMLHRGPQIPGHEMSFLGAAMRYTGDNYIASGSFGTQGINLCYYHKASKQLQLGVELQSDFNQGAIASIGYQVDLGNEFVFHGSLDSQWNSTAVLEKKLFPMPVSFSLCSQFNPGKDQFRLGVGLLIG